MVALKEDGYQGVRTGQLVIHAMDASAGAVGVSDSDGKCTPEYIVCNPRDPGTSPGYFARALRLAAQSSFIEVACQAVRERAPRLRYPNFGTMLLPLPPEEEQAVIVRYLDYVDLLVRRLVWAKQKLIGLLNEHKQGIILYAVTHGLDPDVALKDSGVEWLGKVPDHWEVKPLRRAIKLLTDFEANGSFANLKANVVLAEDDGYAWYVRATDLANNRIDRDPGNNFCNKATYHFLTKTHLNGGELLVTKRGEIGKVYIMPTPQVPATLAPNQYLIRLNRLLEPKYVYRFMLSTGQIQLKALDKSTTIGALYKDDIKNYLLPYPPLSEQTAIVEYLDHKIADIDASISHTNHEIELLNEYHTRLIADVVTGKLDVREAALNLLENHAHPEALENIEENMLDDIDSISMGADT